jgi:hypothetical protein
MGIQNLAYHKNLDMLLVAYKNSNIDLIFKDEVVNLGDIFRKQMTGNKAINNITFHGNEALLACGFGIVAVNLDRREIKDTYIIGENGAQVAVFDVEPTGKEYLLPQQMVFLQQVYPIPICSTTAVGHGKLLFHDLPPNSAACVILMVNCWLFTPAMHGMEMKFTLCKMETGIGC